ncbi:unnamed protein product, partial [Callosobruchus maculatus]
SFFCLPIGIRNSDQICKNAGSRASDSSLQSPVKSVASSPPKSDDSSSSLNKFHNRLLDKLKKSLKTKDSDERRSS